MATSIWERASHIATALSAIVAALAIAVGFYQFNKTRSSDREAKAVDLLIKYNEAMKQGHTGDVRDVWLENLSIVIAESIFRLERGDRGWEKTVRGIVAEHKYHLTNNRIDCGTFDSDFIRLAKEELRQDVCAP